MEDFLLDYTANVSLGGVFIQTDQPLDVGTRFRLRLQIPYRKRPLETLGEVRWTQDGSGYEEAGMGVRFDALASADRRARSKARRFITGNDPGRPRQVGQTWVYGARAGKRAERAFDERCGEGKVVVLPT